MNKMTRIDVYNGIRDSLKDELIRVFDIIRNEIYPILYSLEFKVNHYALNYDDEYQTTERLFINGSFNSKVLNQYFDNLDSVDKYNIMLHRDYDDISEIENPESVEWCRKINSIFRDYVELYRNSFLTFDEEIFSAKFIMWHLLNCYKNKCEGEGLTWSDPYLDFYRTFMPVLPFLKIYLSREEILLLNDNKIELDENGLIEVNCIGEIIKDAMNELDIYDGVDLSDYYYREDYIMNEEHIKEYGVDDFCGLDFEVLISGDLIITDILENIFDPIVLERSRKLNKINKINK